MQDSQIQIQVEHIKIYMLYEYYTHTNTRAMRKYSSKVINVGSVGCLKGQGNAYCPKYACCAVPYQ